MKKWPIPVLLVSFLIVSTLAGCGGGNKGGPGGGTTYNPGQSRSYLVGGVLFNMCYVPSAAGFPTGTDDQGAPGSVGNAYWMAETEVTYQLWTEVYAWATDDARGANQYVFANPGVGDTRRPIASVSWWDAIVWCNALTEFYNALIEFYDPPEGTTLACVYTDGANIIRRTDAADVAVNAGAKGFRLPTNLEWELAARYKDGSSWTPGNYASGATAACTDAFATQEVAVYNVGFASPVGQKDANALNLRDMSGNLYEWCFDWRPGYEGSRRAGRGGGWHSGADELQVGEVNGSIPTVVAPWIGFRPVRTE